MRHASCQVVGSSSRWEDEGWASRVGFLSVAVDCSWQVHVRGPAFSISIECCGIAHVYGDDPRESWSRGGTELPVRDGRFAEGPRQAQEQEPPCLTAAALTSPQYFWQSPYISIPSVSSTIRNESQGYNYKKSRWYIRLMVSINQLDPPLPLSRTALPQKIYRPNEALHLLHSSIHPIQCPIPVPSQANRVPSKQKQKQVSRGMVAGRYKYSNQPLSYSKSRQNKSRQTFPVRNPKQRQQGKVRKTSTWPVPSRPRSIIQ